MLDLLIEKVAFNLKHKTFESKKEPFDPREPALPGHRPPDPDYEARKFVEKRFK